MELIRFINETFWGTSGYVVLLARSLCYILLEKNGDSRGKMMALYSVLVFVVVICNPVIGNIATQKFMSDDVYAYLRIFYVLPLMSVIAYAAAGFYTKEVPADASRRKKLLLAAIICITIIISGKLYDSGMYVKAENLYKISEDALEIYDVIEGDCKGETVRVLLPNEEAISCGIRQYTDKIIIPAYSDAFSDAESLAELEKEKEFSYVVIPKEIRKMAVLEESGYTMTGETYGYAVYKK